MNEIIIKNPLTNWIKDSIDRSKNRLNFAVPFLTSFSNLILNDLNTCDINDKRIITRFDDSSLSSFDLPSLRKLLDLGFTIQYDNSIHLKLYITDNEVYITSSNLTKGGFEDNVELSVKTDSNNIQDCIDIFNEIWINCSNNKLTYEIIDDNWAKYEVLRKREKHSNVKNKNINSKAYAVGEIETEKLISAIFNQKQDYSWRLDFIYESNKLKKKTLNRIYSGFKTEFFYAPVGHEKRRDCLFHELLYGPEVKIAGTGLWEKHFKTIFEHQEFKNVISYLLPETVGIRSWNLSDKDELLEFCNGVFDFNIKYYTEAMPIRLATYFYPDFFLPIFKLQDLRKVCDAFGLKTDAETKGDKLFVYNTFLVDKMKELPYNNSIKSDISYQILYTVELYNRLKTGDSYETILSDYKKIWKKGFIENGKKLLEQLDIIQ